MTGPAFLAPGALNALPAGDTSRFLGPPFGATFDVGSYRIQVFAGGGLWCRVGEWENVREGLPPVVST